jgi:hypothetical protein
MKIITFLIFFSCLAAWGTLGRVTPAWAQPKVFLDVPKIQVPPQDIIADSEFTDGEEDPAPDAGEGDATIPPVGKLAIDVTPGEVILVPVVIADGAEDVISYAFRVTYNKKVLRVLDITGGVFAGYPDAPLTNRGAFESGRVDFTASNVGLKNTPDNFQVAALSFEVIGKAKQRSWIAIRKTPLTDLTLLRTFGAANRVRFQKGVLVRVR